MTLLTPLYAAIAAAIAIPALVILYFLKLRRRDVEISTTLLWKKAIEDLQANAPFQRLRRNILLILQLLILIAALLALGQPYIKGQSLVSGKYVILIDRSASMTALDEDDPKGGKMTRLDAAKKQAVALVESLREGNALAKTFGDKESDEAMVIAFDTTAEVRQTFTGDKRALRDAIEAITPTESPTSMEEAMRLARAHAPRKIIDDVRTDASGNTTRETKELEGLTSGTPLQVHLFSDGRIPDAERSRPNVEDTFEYHRVGTPAGPNVGITGLRVERSFEEVGKLSVFVAIENNEPMARTVDVELVVEGSSALIKSTTIPAASGAYVKAPGDKSASTNDKPADAPAPASPGSPPAESPDFHLNPGSGGVVFSLDRPDGALVNVILRQPGSSDSPANDVLSIDNRAWIVAPPAKRLAVCVVAPTKQLFLETLLGGLSLSRLTEATPSEFDELLKQGKAGEYDVVILSKCLPTVNLTSTGLPPGRYLVLGAVPTGGSGLIDSGKIERSTVIDWSRSHAALRDVSMDGILAVEARKMELADKSQAQVLATSDTGVALAEITSAESRALVLNFDPADSTWTFKESYVVFTVSAIKYLGQDVGSTSVGRVVQPGSVLSDRLPAGVERAVIETPSSDRQELIPSADGRIVFGPISKTGMYKVTWTGPAGPTDTKEGDKASRLYAANLLDPSESDTAAASRLDLANQVVAARTESSAQADKKLWPYLVLGALAVMLIEWFVYNRKVHV